MTDPHRLRDTPGPDTPGTAPRTPERRKGAPKLDDATLLAGLTPEQQATIHTMETFHWRLKFVRRPSSRSPSPCCSTAKATATWWSTRTGRSMSSRR